MDLSAVQRFLREHDLDGWLLADFHGRNTIAVRVLGIEGKITRRSCYFVPRDGEPCGLVHAVERDKMAGLPGRITVYSSYRDMERWLSETLAGRHRLAMEFSPCGRLPYVALVDAGTVDLVRSFGHEVVSSADLVAAFEARLTPEQLDLHREAAHRITAVKDETFAHIAEAVSRSRRLSEFDAVRFMQQRFADKGMITEFAPNCSVDANAGNPHYEPAEAGSLTVSRGKLVLLDLWARLDVPDGVHADITWMGFAGSRQDIPARFVELFDLVARARDAAFGFLVKTAPQRPVFGCEVDDICRSVVVEAGLGDRFSHRTGHSIGGDVHGNGPNIDNLETEDRRALQPGHLFSLEPGVYFEDCGFRTEIDAFITDRGCETACLPFQTEIVSLL